MLLLCSSVMGPPEIQDAPGSLGSLNSTLQCKDAEQTRMAEKQITFCDRFIKKKKSINFHLHFQHFKPAEGKMKFWLKENKF